jgi:uncharacterized protein DUF5666
MIRDYSLIRSIFATSLAAFLLIGFLACGGGSGNGGGNPPPPAATTLMQLKLGDAESDRVLSFTATLDSLTLVSSSGKITNLLATPMTVELTRTAGKMQTLAQLQIPQGSYTAANYQFSNIYITAWDVPYDTFSDFVGSGSMPGSITLNPSITVGATPQILDLDLDLRDSISFDSAGDIYLDPQFSLAAVNIGRAASQIAEDGSAEDMIGVVQSVATSSFTMSLGSGSNTVQVGFDSSTQGQSAALLARDALVEVDAITRGDGSFYANRIDFVETGNLALVEGVVIEPTSWPPGLPPAADSAIILVQKVWAPPQTPVPNVGDTVTLAGLSNAGYTFDYDKLDSWGQGYLTFSNSNLWTGQSVLALVNPGTSTLNVIDMKLVEIAVNGVISGYDPQQYGFTLNIPADSAYQNSVNLMPQTYLSVWDQAENKTVWFGFPQGGPQNGMPVRVRGLAFWTWNIGYMPGGPTMVPTRIDYLPVATAAAQSRHAVGQRLQRKAIAK